MNDTIRAEKLVKRYGKVTALDGIDLAVPQGTVLARAKREVGHSKLLQQNRRLLCRNQMQSHPRQCNQSQQ